MCAVTDIIRDVFGADDDQSESVEGMVEGAPLRLRVTVLLTDPYFTRDDETVDTITSALGNDFDGVEVMDIEPADDDDFEDFDYDYEDDIPDQDDDVLVGDTDPSTGIVHYPGVED